METVCRENVSQADAESAIDQFIADGYDVVFAASPVFLEACVRQCAAHPGAKILNCSVLASYHNVRSYYLRVYEAKFILGAIAASLSETDEIGYIADYPIYGTPASINAFALGAQLVNPRAKIVLECPPCPATARKRRWPRAAYTSFPAATSARRIWNPGAFGLYHEQDGVISNLAMPVWGWGKLYEGIVRSILTGAWNDEGEHNADRAMNYYMGMSTDAIDLICSQRLPTRTRRLVDLLHERIRAGAFLPFVGRLPTRAAKSAWRPTWRSPRRKSSAWIIWRIISSAAFPRWTS